jgi:hypothetical protein
MMIMALGEGWQRSVSVSFAGNGYNYQTPIVKQRLWAGAMESDAMPLNKTLGPRKKCFIPTCLSMNSSCAQSRAKHYFRAPYRKCEALRRFGNTRRPPLDENRYCWLWLCG